MFNIRAFVIVQLVRLLDRLFKTGSNFIALYIRGRYRDIYIFPKGTGPQATESKVKPDLRVIKNEDDNNGPHNLH